MKYTITLPYLTVEELILQLQKYPTNTLIGQKDRHGEVTLFTENSVSLSKGFVEDNKRRKIAIDYLEIRNN